ncbi:MAG: helix-turn-helix transcriptional regulator [Actinomycetota bacterium]
MARSTLDVAAPQETHSEDLDQFTTRTLRTRDVVAHLVLSDGPITVTEIAERLAMTPPAVRRHLDVLVQTGIVEAKGREAKLGRGRPAQRYILTDAGHETMNSEYDDLAAAALAFVAEQLGSTAVHEFAIQHIAIVEARYADLVAAAGTNLIARTEALAAALSRDGYAASVRPVGDESEVGIQLCQGHCPVQRVARQFPQLCEAEAAAFARLLGVHVQRLATLATGAHVCTTHIPTTQLSPPAQGRNTP